MATQLERRFNSPSLGASILDGFRQLRQEAVLCELQLVVGNQKSTSTGATWRLEVHTSANFLHGRFQREGTDTSGDQRASAGALRAVLDYLYSGDVVINHANLTVIIFYSDDIIMNLYKHSL